MPNKSRSHSNHHMRLRTNILLRRRDDSIGQAKRPGLIVQFMLEERKSLGCLSVEAQSIKAVETINGWPN